VGVKEIMKGNTEEIDRYIFHGIHGPYETRRQERVLYLGSLRERVLKALTREQVREPWVYQEIIRAAHSKKAKKIIVSGDIARKHYKKYEELARQAGLRFKLSSSGRYKGDTGLVVLADQAVENNTIAVPGRMESYRGMNIPLPLSGGKKRKVCAKCYHRINRLAPELIGYYRRLRFFDKLLGERCEC